ncbi:alpha-amylase [Thiomicrospira aerophila AL3]|uniref:Alpha-amylase n=1 Tax=Thiomicrospira aerophila AL3 TaxID=717772 RepID=W0DUC1_9GAMM|nr:sugar phosphorylase [Thiomicrospira aerophila]AHF02047.1 alpha-amylase [Thiomicrospira aerophila AL3]
MATADLTLTQILTRLQRLYSAEQAQECYQQLCEAMTASRDKLAQKQGRHAPAAPSHSNVWSQDDVVLITYGDSIYDAEGGVPLRELKDFLAQHVQDAISHVHLLPFFPYSSDDGFSVIDYLQVDPDLGDWQDVAALHQHYKLMFDYVLNHVSRESLWFTDFKANVAPFNEFFIEVDPKTDVSMVVRPRNTPLLVPAYTHAGRKWVWATFSADQIDLNFANPAVLLKMLDVLLFYIEQGAEIVRLDAVAFLWKVLGTPSIHLPQTHEVVKLIRDVMAWVSPNSLVLTETNVPHQENVSYFGEGDEAHLVYQFSLAPLVLHALYRGDGQYLTAWAQDLAAPPPGCNYLNFTASHDGIGLRPVEGLLPDREIEDLIAGMHRQGGYVSMRSRPDGSQSPYEINISLFSAFRETCHGLGPDQWQVDRFICSQLIMLSLQGIPALYIHSLLATVNDQEGVERTGRTRSINRRKWAKPYLEALLAREHSPNAKVLKRLVAVLKRRKKHRAFHPDTNQQVLNLGPAFFALWRGLGELKFPLLAVFNLTNDFQTFDLAACLVASAGIESQSQQWVNLLDHQTYDQDDAAVMLAPYQVLWLMPGQLDDVNPLWAMHTD